MSDQKSSGVAYCEACQRVGMMNCSDFVNCGNVRCVTCKQLWPEEKAKTADQAAEIARLSAALDEALAQLEEERARNAWQPMETAPRNGTSILVHLPGSRRPVQEVWWAIAYEGGPGYWSTPFGPAGRGYTILPESPSHWMPLPAPPLAIIPGAKE